MTADDAEAGFEAPTGATSPTDEFNEALAHLMARAPSVADFRQALDGQALDGAAPGSPFPVSRRTDPMASFWQEVDGVESQAPAGYLQRVSHAGSWRTYVEHLVTTRSTAQDHRTEFPPLLRIQRQLRDIYHHVGTGNPRPDFAHWANEACRRFAPTALAAELYGEPPSQQLRDQLSDCYKWLVDIASFLPGSDAQGRRTLATDLARHLDTIDSGGAAAHADPAIGGLAALDVAEDTVAILAAESRALVVEGHLNQAASELDDQSLADTRLQLRLRQVRAAATAQYTHQRRDAASAMLGTLQAQRDAREIIAEATMLVHTGIDETAPTLTPDGGSRRTARTNTAGAAELDPMCTEVQCRNRAHVGDLCDMHLRTGRRLAVRPSAIPGAGLGLITTTERLAGQTAAWLSGRVLSTMPTNPALLRWCFPLTPHEWLDASSRGTSVGRFINHSDAPNCEIITTGAGDRREAVIRTLDQLAGRTELTVAYPAWGVALLPAGAATAAQPPRTTSRELALARVAALRGAAAAVVMTRDITPVDDDDETMTSAPRPPTPRACCANHPHAAAAACGAPIAAAGRIRSAAVPGNRARDDTTTSAWAGQASTVQSHSDEEEGTQERTRRAMPGTESGRLAITKWFPTVPADGIEDPSYTQPARDTAALKLKRDARRKYKRLVTTQVITHQVMQDFLDGICVGSMTPTDTATGKRAHRPHALTQTQAAGNSDSDEAYGPAGRRQRAAARQAHPQQLDAEAVTAALAPRAGSAYAPITVLECRAAARYTLNDPTAAKSLKEARYTPDPITDIVTCAIQRCSYTAPNPATGEPTFDDTHRCKETAPLGDLCAYHLDTTMGLAVRRSTHPLCRLQWGLFTTRPFQPYERIGPYAGDKVHSHSHGPYVATDTRGMSGSQLQSPGAQFGIEGQRTNAGYTRLINDVSGWLAHFNNACLYSGRYDACAWAAVRALAAGIPAHAEIFMSYGAGYFGSKAGQSIKAAAALATAAATGTTSTDPDTAFVDTEDAFRASAQGEDTGERLDAPPVPGDTAGEAERATRRSARTTAVTDRATERSTALSNTPQGVGALYPDAPTHLHRVQPAPLTARATATAAAATSSEAATHAKKRAGDGATASSAKRARQGAGSRRSSRSADDTAEYVPGAAETVVTASGRETRLSQRGVAAVAAAQAHRDMDAEDAADMDDAEEGAQYRAAGARLIPPGLTSALDAAVAGDLTTTAASGAIERRSPSRIQASALGGPPSRTPAQFAYEQARRVYVTASLADLAVMRSIHEYQGTEVGAADSAITQTTWAALFHSEWKATNPGATP